MKLSEVETVDELIEVIKQALMTRIVWSKDAQGVTLTDRGERSNRLYFMNKSLSVVIRVEDVSRVNLL